MINDIQGLDIKIEKMIYEIRGQHVMLDSDLATLYQYLNGTKTINLSLKRHLELFNEDCVFQINETELDNLRSRSETSSDVSETSSSYGGRRYFPYVFTLEGIKILSTILRKPNVKNVTEEIVKAFANIESKKIKVSQSQYLREIWFKI